MYYMMLACMTGPKSTGQQMATHLFLHILSIIIFYFARITIPREQALLHTLVATVQKTMAWCLQGHACSVCKKRDKRYKKQLESIKKATKLQVKQGRTFYPFFLPPSRLVVT